MPLSARFFEDVVAALGDAVIATDLEDRVRYWNPAAEELFGYSSKQALGRFLRDLIMAQPEAGRAAGRGRKAS